MDSSVINVELGLKTEGQLSSGSINISLMDHEGHGLKEFFSFQEVNRFSSFLYTKPKRKFELGLEAWEGSFNEILSLLQHCLFFEMPRVVDKHFIYFSRFPKWLYNQQNVIPVFSVRYTQSGQFGEERKVNTLHYPLVLEQCQCLREVPCFESS